MKNNFIAEIFISVVMLGLVVALLNPFGLWMTDMATMSVIVLLVVVTTIFVIYVWNESAKDEREVLHRFYASRLAFLLGTAILIIGVVVEGLNHSVDIWLVLALAVMIFAKIGGRIYAQLKR